MRRENQTRVKAVSSPTPENQFEKRKMTNTTELLRRGATLLREACPRCGGVQVRYRDKVYCVNEDEIESVLYASEAKPETKQTQEKVSKPPASETAPENERTALRKLLEDKLVAVSKELESTKDVDRQVKLLDLISKYLETLSKLEASIELEKRKA